MSGGAQDRALLRRLSRLYGVQTAYSGMGHEHVEANPDSLIAVLRALGAPVEGARDLDDALRQRQRDLWRCRLEPVLVAWEGVLPHIDLRLPEAQARGRYVCTVVTEVGETRRSEGDLEAQPRRGRREIDGEACLHLVLPGIEGLPHGYHRLSLEAGGQRFEALLIASPRRTYAPPIDKTWGPFLPLYALHSQRSLGIGDLTDLGQMMDWAAGEGAGFAGTLPLLASFLDNPCEPSPYAPVSRLFWNELYIDPAAPLATGEPANVDNLDMSEVARLNAEPLVPYAGVMALKRRVMETQAATLTAPALIALDAHLENRPAIRDYARWRAAVDTYGANWRAWPGAAARGDLSQADLSPETEAYWTYAQWRASTQMRDIAAKSRERGVSLYLDLPVGVHADGYDAWRYQSLFAEGMSVGAPPDVVTTSGQDWGFQPLSPEATRRAGYAYVINYLRHHFEAAGILRVDHAMGFHRLYWVPRGAGAANGVYVTYPADELYAILCLESQRHESSVVFENLGIVTQAMDEAFGEHGVGRMYVLSIELRQDEDPPYRAVPEDVVASLGTHDLPPFAAWWRSDDIDERLALGVLSEERAVSERDERWLQHQALIAYLREQGIVGEDPAIEDVLRACIALLAQSDAQRLLINVEDLWLEDRPQNVPGTTADQYPSWQRRARYALEEIAALPEVQEALSIIKGARAGGASHG